MMKTWIVALVVCLLSGAAVAQTGSAKTAAALNAEVASTLASGQNPPITAAMLRQVVLDMIATTYAPQGTVASTTGFSSTGFSVDSSGNALALSVNGARFTTLEEQAVSPKCVPDGVTDCLAAFNAASASFTYAAFTVSGGEIRLNEGNYFFSNSMDVTGKNGLTISGRGLLATTVSVGSGNYPNFIDSGTFLVPTNKVVIQDINIVCGGKAKANANGVQLSYTNTGYVVRDYFNSCKHAVDLTGVFETHVSFNRMDGLGTQQNETCLYMHSPTDVNDNVGNNSAVIYQNVCQNQSLYGARLENATGSVFIGNQWLTGVTGVYYCDPPIATFPCQFTFFTGDQVDTTSAQSWLFIKGLASSMGVGVVLTQPWAGSGVTAAFDIQNATQLQIYDAEVESNDIGFKVAGATNSTFTGHLYNINQHNNGSQGVLLSGTTSNNVVKLQPIPTSTFALVGYNGIVETGTFSNNQFWAGPAACALGLAFGGSSVGITYSNGPATANECQYEVKGMSVRLQFLMTLTAKPVSSGAVATITGLPITVGPNIAWAYGGISIFAAQAGFTGLTGPIIAQTVPATTTSSMVQQGATGYANLVDSNFSATSNFAGSLEYMKQ